MSKVKNSEEPSNSTLNAAQQTANSIVITGNDTAFRPAVQSDGRNTNQQISANTNKSGSTTKVQPTTSTVKENPKLSDEHMKAIKRYERKLKASERVDPEIIKSILAAGVVREYTKHEEKETPPKYISSKIN